MRGASSCPKPFVFFGRNSPPRMSRTLGPRFSAVMALATPRPVRLHSGALSQPVTKLGPVSQPAMKHAGAGLGKLAGMTTGLAFD